ncbi:MAG: ATP-binding protein, partial [Rhizomicrobium sp.]
TAVAVTPNDPLYHSPDFPLRTSQYPSAYYFAVKLKDGSWLVFMGYGRYWGLSQSQRLGVWLVFLLLAVVGVSVFTTRLISRPIKQFANAVRLRGIDLQALQIKEVGPQELREVVAAFNEMQLKIQEFIAYRTDMLAAISHDLRTPLTRMRLRGEYIEDRGQRDRLFQDVQEMQTMIDGALAFFRNDGDEEVPRTFDLAEILQTIVDDFADQGIEVTYTGIPHCVYSGRPIALKRAFTNLIENAVKYATPPDVELVVTDKTVSIEVRDCGPGIPVAELEKVFQPFYRLEKSRNRMSGGVGLGLTAALAVIRGHGGTLHIHNRSKGGLEAIVTLPLILPNLNPTKRKKTSVGHLCI